MQAAEKLQRLTGHRPWEHIAANQHLICANIGNILKNSLQGWEINVNIVDSSKSYYQRNPFF